MLQLLPILLSDRYHSTLLFAGLVAAGLRCHNPTRVTMRSRGLSNPLQPSPWDDRLDFSLKSPA
ncbi:MAG: hypothetical protein AAGA60_20600 [Cyanobacteria bacterium P01_E01_bin.42]